MGSGVARESRAMKKILLVALILCWSHLANATYEIVHIEPAFWWVGMTSPKLQLLVHGENIAHLEPQVDYPGVVISDVHRVENNNYLFVDLELGHDVKPGKFSLRFTKDAELVISESYELRERVTNSADRPGFGPQDVIYLIAPDRFANGNPANDHIPALAEGANRQDPNGRHGGDLQGLLDHLDYIAGMGFTQLWLNPVLQNNQPKYSYHGYAITDFYQIDGRYGSNALYLTLSQEAQKRGIGLIMDMVLNHSGSAHWWMADLPTPDWINNRGVFTPTSHKREALHDPHGVVLDQEAFSSGWFVPSMPDLNQRNPFLATYLIQNSIWWVEYAALSGIRVDTYSYSDKDFLTQWTQRLISEYPNLNIVGEEWSLNPAIVSYWQRGKDTHDGYVSYLPSVMDFPLQNAVVSGLLQEESWESGLTQIYDTIAADFIYADPYNLVVFPDNHDMDRIVTQLDEQYDLYQMAMVYFLTTRGIPQIFYGTEILMSNPDSNSHGIIRSDFPGGWPDDKVNAFTGKGLTENQNNAIEFLRQLLNWRKNSMAVHRGELTHYVPQNKTYVYFRHYDDRNGEMVMVVLNKNEDSVSLDTRRFYQFLGVGAKGIDVISGNEYDLSRKVHLQPRSALVLEVKPGKASKSNFKSSLPE